VTVLKHIFINGRIVSVIQLSLERLAWSAACGAILCVGHAINFICHVMQTCFQTRMKP